MSIIEGNEYNLKGSMVICYLNREGELIGWASPSVVMLAMKLSYEKKEIGHSYMRAIVFYAFSWRNTSKSTNYWLKASCSIRCGETGAISETLAKEMLAEVLKAECGEYHCAKIML